jgi:dTDP-4-dehydrorhamnose reductase
MAVVGAEGFVGSRLLRALRRARPATPGTSRRGGDGLLPLDLARPNAERLDAAARAWADQGVAAAVLCAGVTNIAQCEQEPEATRRINVDSVEFLASCLARAGILPVFLSSDAVFGGGQEAPYTEEDPVAPRNEYGRQKVLAEQALLDHGPCLILRLSKLFGRAGEGCFLDGAARCLRAGEPVAAARDLFFNPLCVHDLPRAVRLAVAAGQRGILHLCGPATVNRLALMHDLAAALDCDPGLVRDISLDDLPGGTRYAKHLGMRCHPFFSGAGMRFTPIAAAIAELADGKGAGPWPQ